MVGTAGLGIVSGARAGLFSTNRHAGSQMVWMRGAVLRATKGMTSDQLDFLLDNKANRIGALVLHLAATQNSITEILSGMLDQMTFTGVRLLRTGLCR